MLDTVTARTGRGDLISAGTAAYRSSHPARAATVLVDQEPALYAPGQAAGAEEVAEDELAAALECKH